MKLVRDAKVIPNEECITRHKPLVWDARIVKSEGRCKNFVWKRHVWKLQQVDLRDELCEPFTVEIKDASGEHVYDIWARLKQSLLYTTDKTCGWTKKGISRWCWNEKARKDISQKRRLWELWKAGGSNNKYLDAKRKAWHAAYTATRNAEKDNFTSVEDN